MSVSLQPDEVLEFRRPLTRDLKCTLRITNNNAHPVTYKVKTTHPKIYSVRPNPSRVEPGETFEISILLQARQKEPALDEKLKHKFLIQSTLITPDMGGLPLQTIWAQAKAGETTEVHQQKLRVTYLPAKASQGSTQAIKQERKSLSSRIFSRLSWLRVP